MTVKHLLLVAVAGILSAAAIAPAQQPVSLSELKSLISPPLRDEGAESLETIPELKKGYSSDIIRAAERAASLRGSEAQGEDAVNLIFGEWRQLVAEHGSIEAAAQSASQEAIVIPNALLRPSLHTCGGLIDDPVPPFWHEELNKRRADLTRIMGSAGLISVANLLNGGPKGTGFVVAKDLVLTNRHVAETFAAANGDGTFRLKTHPATGQPARVTVDFTVDRCSMAARPCRVTEVIHIEPDPGPDVALLRVTGEVPARLELETIAPSEPLSGRMIVVVGYPFSDSRNPFDIQSQVFGFEFGVKRLAPGMLMEGSGRPLAAEQEALLLHDCSTLGGCSGAAVVDMSTNRVVGIHFGGRFQENNFAWPMWRVLTIDKIAAALEE